MDYQKETDARIVIDDLLRKAGWDPADKSMVETEVLVNWPAGRERDSVPVPDNASPSSGRDTFGRADGYDPDKIQGGGRPETPERNDIPDLLAQWRLYKKSGFRKPPGVKVGAVLPEGTAESRSWWTAIDALTEDFSLAAGRYKPQIAEAAPEGNPAQLIRETLALEREIVTGLEKLLKEIEG